MQFFAVSLPIVLSTFGIIFVAELPDKTALASLVLATRFKAREVILGAWLAMLAQTILAVAAGGALALLPARPVHLIAGISFLVFSYFAFKRKEEENLAKEAQEVHKEGKNPRAAWLTSFLVVFAAEWGDLSQLATAGLAAHTASPLSVGIGAVLGLWAVIALAAVAGGQLTRLLTPKRLRLVSGTLFVLIGLFMIVSVFLK
jgi:putative Ca2+/H+ antiporter (TMEM165/GDT1 family)